MGGYGSGRSAWRHRFFIEDLLCIDIRQWGYPGSSLILENQILRIVYSKCGRYGKRPWLICPYCGKRVAILYEHKDFYHCRACLGNPPYRSQNMAEIDRLCARRDAIHERLEWYDADANQVEGPKPYGMRRKTFKNLCKRLVRIQGRFFEIMANLIAKHGHAMQNF